MVRVVARRWSFEPASIALVRGAPVILELISSDRRHGFLAPALGLRAEIVPGTPARLAFTPDRAGTFPFHCDVFCGEGHDGMTGEIVVAP